MANLYLFAFLNLMLCCAVGIIALCRLASMNGAVLQRVRSEYAIYMAAACASAIQPWWGEWPGWGSLAVASALLAGLLCSSHAWHAGPPESSKRCQS